MSSTLRFVLFLSGSNIFMTFAWYGHLKHLDHKPVWIAILVSWGIAFFEYCL
ncbi:MAG: DMT family protein, partial [bacterium]